MHVKQDYILPVYNCLIRNYPQWFCGQLPNMGGLFHHESHLTEYVVCNYSLCLVVTHNLSLHSVIYNTMRQHEGCQRALHRSIQYTGKLYPMVVCIQITGQLYPHGSVYTVYRSFIPHGSVYTVYRSVIPHGSVYTAYRPVIPPW